MLLKHLNNTLQAPPYKGGVVTFSSRRGILLLLFFFAITLATNAQTFTRYADTLDLDEYTSLEEALKEPEKVKRLSLKRKGLKEFPKDIYKFKNLVELDLR